MGKACHEIKLLIIVKGFEQMMNGGKKILVIANVSTEKSTKKKM